MKLGRADLDMLKGKEETGGWKKLFSFGKKTAKQITKKKSVVGPDFNRKQTLVLTEDSIQNDYTLSDCCKPIPGDVVMGYIDDDKHIIIHKLQCPNAAKLKANHGNRVLAAKWEMSRMSLFPVSIHVKSQLNGVNIRNLEVECDDGIFECTVQMYVHDTKEVDEIIEGLRAIQDVKEASRI